MGSSLGFSQPGSHPQRERRDYTEAFTDQHGRSFGAQFDKQNLRPIGEFIPIGHQPPWRPPMRYVRWGKHGFQFRWDYDTMASELAADASEYYDDVTKFMIQHLPHEPLPRVGDPVPREVRQVLGPPPMSPAIPLAAAAGDPWLLGMPGAPKNEKLATLLSQVQRSGARETLAEIKARVLEEVTNPVETQDVELDEPKGAKAARSIHSVDTASIGAVSYTEFMGTAMKGGLTMAQAAQAWKIHRDNLAAQAAEDAA